MQIEERSAGDVTILDLKGKMTLGEGDEILKDKINSLVLQGRKKIVLNLAGVPYIDSAGLGEIVRTYTTVSRQGGSSEAPQPDQAHHGSALDHEAADRVRNLRQRSRRRPELLRPLRRSDGRAVMARSLLTQVPPATERPVADVRTLRARSTAVSLRPEQWTKNLLVFAGLLFGGRLLDPTAALHRHVAAFVIFCALVGRDLPRQRRAGSRRRSPTPAQADAADCLRRTPASTALIAAAALVAGGGVRRIR